MTDQWQVMFKGRWRTVEDVRVIVSLFDKRVPVRLMEVRR